NPGNSGGPLFNSSGQVIGITSSIATTSQSSGSIGLGFAIPVDLATNIANQLIEDGSAEHAFLGVTLTNGMAKVDGASRVGAKVHEVVPDTPADRAGIKPDDVITAIDGQTVGGAESLTGWVRTYSGGDEVTLTLVRDGEQQKGSVTLSTSGTLRSCPRRPAGSRVGAGRVGPDGVRPHCRPWGPEGPEGPEGPVLGRSSGSRAHPSTPNADY